MAFIHGKSSGIKIDNSAGVLTDMSAYCDEISFPRTVETGETTTFGVASGAKTYIVGLQDSTISLSGKFDNGASAVDAHFAGVIAAHMGGTLATATFEYGPEGTGSGKIRYTGEAIVTSYEVSSPVADVVTWSAEMQVTGAVTRNTF